MPGPYKILAKLQLLLDNPNPNTEVQKFMVMELCTDAILSLCDYTVSHPYDSDIIGIVVRKRIGEAQRQVGVQ